MIFQSGMAHLQAIDNIRHSAEINALVRRIVFTLQRGCKIMFCGNGGSAAMASHLAAEFVGRFENPDRPGLAAISLTADTAVMTAIANDMDYRNIFSRQITAIGHSGDMLFLLSTSGNSRNMTTAIASAQALGVYTVAMTGANNLSACAVMADSVIYVNSENTARIQEMHLMIGHVLCELVENDMYPRDLTMLNVLSEAK